MKKPTHGEDCFGYRCLSCGSPIKLDNANYEVTDAGTYRVKCSNRVCRQPVNEYDPKGADYFRATQGTKTEHRNG
jgi:hypothetical protein